MATITSIRDAKMAALTGYKELLEAMKDRDSTSGEDEGAEVSVLWWLSLCLSGLEIICYCVYLLHTHTHTHTAGQTTPPYLPRGHILRLRS